MNHKPTGYLSEIEKRKRYSFEYLDSYQGDPLSLTWPLSQRTYVFEGFPAFFDGLLPEGPQLHALLKQQKLDEDDYFGQLLAVGKNLVGAVSLEADS